VRDVVIVGAGAMGCLFAARLAEAGTQVTLVDVDRARLEAPFEPDPLRLRGGADDVDGGLDHRPQVDRADACGQRLQCQ